MTNGNDTAQSELDPVKQLLLELVEQKGTNLAAVSRAIKRNHAYLQQYIAGRPPRFLPPSVREALGLYFGVDPARFRDPGSGEPPRPQQSPHPVMLARAIAFTGRVLEGYPLGEDARAQITATVYVLLERQLLSDQDETVRVLKSMLEGLRSTAPNAGEPSNG